MNKPPKRWLSQCLSLLTLLVFPLQGFADKELIQREIELIREQNRVLEQQVEMLNDKVARIESKRVESTERPDHVSDNKTNSAAFPIVKLGAQGGLGWSYAGPGWNSAFFVDDVKLSLRARISPKIDFFTDLNLNTMNSLPEQYVEYFPNRNGGLTLNEIYLDFRNVLEPLGYGNWLNIRAGQFYIPFGEEYQYRYPFENPLIWRSAADVWGLSPGLEFYGGKGKWSYEVAIQNRSRGVEVDVDKSVAGRIRFDANKNFRISFSAMRTADLENVTSALWLDGYPAFTGLAGSNSFVIATEAAKQAALFEVSPELKWNTGYLKAWGGVVLLDEGAFERNDWYYSVEAVQYLFPKLYAAGRVSQVFLPDGEHTRLSGGLGYRFNSDVILKTDFTYDHIWHKNPYALGTELAFRF
jgi:hypothetical protein